MSKIHDLYDKHPVPVTLNALGAFLTAVTIWFFVPKYLIGA